MDSYNVARMAATQRLTQLYTDTKRSSQVALSQGSIDDPPELQSLNRKFRLQKDRLIAWGLEWSDKADDGGIDRSVEQAGLTEVVESIMENIKDILDAVERFNSQSKASTGIYPAEKPSMSRAKSVTPADITRYGDLVNDMTLAIDLLCDLSKSRRMSHEDRKSGLDKGDAKGGYHGRERASTPVPAYPTHQNSDMAGYTAQSYSEGTMDSSISPEASGIPMISASLLVLPQEGPPAYGDSRITFRGASSSPRLFGHLRQSPSLGYGYASQSPSNLIPVMIEYARFDRLYKETAMTLPLARLNRIHSILQSWNASASSTLTKPIAYFEDPDQPRIGLVFELPPQMQSLQQGMHGGRIGSEEPTTLSMLLQLASKPPTGSTTSNAPIIPPLEHRFRLAQQLVNAFRFMQGHNFSHRNVSSSSIALLPSVSARDQQQGVFDLRRPVLCSVDLFSEYDVDPSPEMLHQNIYRHPDDPRIRGPSAAQEYDPRFDLYSLSLVLLEIGMWHPLADLYKEKYSLKDFRTRVEKVWIRRLSGRCGMAYTRCVNDLFQAGSKRHPSQDAKHLINVLDLAAARLERCCLIDDEDDEEGDAFDVGESEAPTAGDLESVSTYLPEKEALQSEPVTFSESDKKVLESASRSPCFLFPDLKIPSDIEKMYENFEDRAARIANKVLRGPRDSFWLALEYAGATKESAKPTICVGCSNPKLVRAALKKHLRYDPGVFELSVFRDCARRSKTSTSSEEKGAQNPGYHERPLCGASIGAWRYGAHSPAVSFGGVIMVDNKPYGMTVHHVLEPEEDEDGFPTTASKATQNDLEIDLSTLELADETDDEDNDDEDAMSLDDLDELELEDEDKFDEAHEDAPDDTPGIEAGEGRRIVVTQPALDDLEDDFFPSEEDRDDEHTLSHRLGHVYSSSGLRFCEKRGIRHEMDWLLFEVDDHRLQPVNVVTGGRKHCTDVVQKRPALKEPVCRQDYPATEDVYPRQVVRSEELPGLSVHCFGRTCGLGEGKISETMRWVRFAGRNNPAKVWSVRGTFGMGGDSGAWAVDNKTGRVCGHVLGWSSNFRVAYISPMDVMFDDISQALRARTVTLPGAATSERPVSSGSMGSSRQDAGTLTFDNIRHHKHLMAKHMLLTGNPSHTEREWTMRRTRLGQVAPC